jgi:hypothetical protein
VRRGARGDGIQRDLGEGGLRCGVGGVGVVLWSVWCCNRCGIVVIDLMELGVRRPSTESLRQLIRVHFSVRPCVLATSPSLRFEVEAGR